VEVKHSAHPENPMHGVPAKAATGTAGAATGVPHCSVADGAEPQSVFTKSHRTRQHLALVAQLVVAAAELRGCRKNIPEIRVEKCY